MPTYTYRCTKCGEEYEVFQSMSDPPLKRCKKCRGALRRTFHPVGIVLKGPGFHKTDYRSSSRKAGEKRDSSAEQSESKAEESDSPAEKSESKASTKSESKTGSKSSDASSKSSSSGTDN